MTFLPALALLALNQAEPPRLKTTLPNGAAVLVERVPGAKRLTVQLWAGPAGVQETAANHGARHLLEHLLVQGADGRLGARLEARGASIRGRTLRDALQIQIDAEPGDLPLALQVVREVLGPIPISAEAVAKEASILAREEDAREMDERLGSAAWRVAYGEAGLDSFGNVDALRQVGPEELLRLRARLLAPANLCLVVAGPVEIDAATREARRVLAELIPSERAPVRPRPPGRPGRAETEGFGELRAAPVPGYASVRTAATLAAALALGSEIEGCFVTYTPTRLNGLVILGRTEYDNGLGLFIDRLEPDRAAGLYDRGKGLALNWVQRQLASLQGGASLRGMLLAQGQAERPENLEEAIRSMTREQFLQGIDAFREANAVTVVGVGRP